VADPKLDKLMLLRRVTAKLNEITGYLEHLQPMDRMNFQALVEMTPVMKLKKMVRDVPDGPPKEFARMALTMKSLQSVMKDFK
jgi:hypothetical protein